MSDSPYINRFLSADTIVPGYANPQNLNRYSYVSNNPLRYTDPTGHMRVEDGPQSNGCSNPKYCSNGQPKSEEELAKIRREKKKDDRDTGPVTDVILSLLGSEDFYNNLATGLDVGAWVVDAFAVGTVIYGGVVGTGLGLPGTTVGGPAAPTVTGLAGIVIAEFWVQPILTFGNVLASFSTVSTAIADTKAGNTRIEEGVFSNSVRNSAALTGVGWVNKEAFVSLAIQSVALSNDFGWTSLPYR